MGVRVWPCVRVRVWPCVRVWVWLCACMCVCVCPRAGEGATARDRACGEGSLRGESRSERVENKRPTHQPRRHNRVFVLVVVLVVSVVPMVPRARPFTTASHLLTKLAARPLEQIAVCRRITRPHTFRHRFGLPQPSGPTPTPVPSPPFDPAPAACRASAAGSPPTEPSVLAGSLTRLGPRSR